MTGNPRMASTSSREAVPAIQSGVGIPAPRRSSFVTSLSIARVHPSRPLPAKGTPRISRSAWIVPSSPAPPWRAGKTRWPPASSGALVSAFHSRRFRRATEDGAGASRATPPATMRSSSPRERSPRAVSRQRTSWPTVSSARATWVPDARETSLSSELPPVRTTTLNRPPSSLPPGGPAHYWTGGETAPRESAGEAPSTKRTGSVTHIRVRCPLIRPGSKRSVRTPATAAESRSR